ncbi:hypothetical protein LN042_30410 [Kitasatospora sp. RB6PN24]|uniref:hypothetical protein n=1 Tax=Kitasatospora humi TaxID=2893891 RepID=UPI001E63F114|nr:hypothetical protein [Kitasatospora humi]MCC9311325.1 hypothetical protein [Kitasatospora humi]
MNFIAHQRAVDALDELRDAIEDAGLDVHDVSGGWRITQAGTVLIQLRPLHPHEALALASAIRPRDSDSSAEPNSDT